VVGKEAEAGGVRIFIYAGSSVDGCGQTSLIKEVCAKVFALFFGEVSRS
jgi:hypothetical protein